MDAIAVICTSSIPVETFHRFFKGAETFIQQMRRTSAGEHLDLSKAVRIITSKDPAQCYPTNERPLTIFTSPFDEETIEAVGEWFKINSSKFGNLLYNEVFLVLDNITIRDNSTCLLVGYKNAFEPAQMMRCDFVAAHYEAFDLNYYPHWDGGQNSWRGRHRRSKLVMTKYSRKCLLGTFFLPRVHGAFEIDDEDEIGHYEELDITPYD